jgi:hypothetical protein
VVIRLPRAPLLGMDPAACPTVAASNDFPRPLAVACCMSPHGMHRSAHQSDLCAQRPPLRQDGASSQNKKRSKTAPSTEPRQAPSPYENKPRGANYSKSSQTLQGDTDMGAKRYGRGN